MVFVNSHAASASRASGSVGDVPEATKEQSFLTIHRQTPSAPTYADALYPSHATVGSRRIPAKSRTASSREHKQNEGVL